jgi:hypothetical protein
MTLSKVRLAVASTLLALGSVPAAAQHAGIDHKVLATNRTSTMEKELNDAAEAGFQFQSVMGGESAFGGSEVIVVMSRSGEARRRHSYRLLATSKTSTMQRELQEAADAGFQYRGQTVFETATNGDQVVVILERDADAPQRRVEYRLMATARTSTLEKELRAGGAAGFEVVGMTVSDTAFGGKELVAITRRTVD